MTNKFEISIFFPCKESIEFRKQFPDFKSAWENCPRGDWMLWIAQKLKIDLFKLTTAKALCANTVRHLMKDERSIKAVDTAILFGQGKVSIEELNAAKNAANAANNDAYTAANNAAQVANNAAYNAYAVTYNAYAAAYSAATYAVDGYGAYASYNAAYAAYASTSDAVASAAAADASAANAAISDAYNIAANAAISDAYNIAANASVAADVARTKNQLQTANICREILTEVVFEAIDKLTT